MTTMTSETLSATDHFMWNLRDDPVLRSTIVSLTLLGRSPDWALLVSRFEDLCTRAPHFRQRVRRRGPAGVPTWEDDPEFDIGFHVRRIAAPEPRDIGVLLELTRRAVMDDFDATHSLWGATLVEGMADGGAALICRFDHSLSDGVGAVGLAALLLDGPGGRDEIGSPPIDGRQRDASASGSRWVRTVASLPGDVAGMAFALARSPVETMSTAAATAASMYRAARPIWSPGSETMGARGADRQVAILEVPKSSLRAAGHAAGGSLNDAYLAAIVGGLRRYHEQHGAPAGDLVVSMPINVRDASDSLAGNRATLARFTVPAAVADPAQRIRAFAERTARLRRERSLDYVDLTAFALNLMPRRYVTSQLRHVDFIASDVPGLAAPVALAGAPVVVQYAFSPTLGSALNATLLSYVDVCAIGLNVDAVAVPDHACLCDCIEAGFDEVLASV